MQEWEGPPGDMSDLARRHAELEARDPAALDCYACGVEWSSRARPGLTVRCPECGHPRRVPMTEAARTGPAPARTPPVRLPAPRQYAPAPDPHRTRTGPVRPAVRPAVPPAPGPLSGPWDALLRVALASVTPTAVTAPRAPLEARRAAPDPPPTPAPAGSPWHIGPRTNGALGALGYPPPLTRPPGQCVMRQAVNGEPCGLAARVVVTLGPGAQLPACEGHGRAIRVTAAETTGQPVQVAAIR